MPSRPQARVAPLGLLSLISASASTAGEYLRITICPPLCLHSTSPLRNNLSSPRHTHTGIHLPASIIDHSHPALVTYWSNDSHPCHPPRAFPLVTRTPRCAFDRSQSISQSTHPTSSIKRPYPAIQSAKRTPYIQEQHDLRRHLVSNISTIQHHLLFGTWT